MMVGTARRRRCRTRSPVVGRHRPAEGHVHVSMRIYKARHHKLAGDIHCLSLIPREVLANGDDLLVLDEHIRLVAALGGNDRPAGEE